MKLDLIKWAICSVGLFVVTAGYADGGRRLYSCDCYGWNSDQSVSLVGSVNIWADESDVSTRANAECGVEFGTSSYSERCQPINAN